MPPRSLLRGIMRLVLDAVDADEVSLYLETRDLSVKLTEEQRPPLHVAFGSVGHVISAPISLASGDGWIRAVRDADDAPFEEPDLGVLISAAEEIAAVQLPDRF